MGRQIGAALRSGLAVSLWLGVTRQHSPASSAGQSLHAHERQHGIDLAHDHIQEAQGIRYKHSTIICVGVGASVLSLSMRVCARSLWHAMVGDCEVADGLYG